VPEAVVATIPHPAAQDPAAATVECSSPSTRAMCWKLLWADPEQVVALVLQELSHLDVPVVQVLISMDLSEAAAAVEVTLVVLGAVLAVTEDYMVVEELVLV
jgi:hypothetical protein